MSLDDLSPEQLSGELVTDRAAGVRVLGLGRGELVTPAQHYPAAPKADFMEL